MKAFVGERLVNVVRTCNPEISPIHKWEQLKIRGLVSFCIERARLKKKQLSTFEELSSDYHLLAFLNNNENVHIFQNVNFDRIKH